ncbi:MAG: terpene cyclase/mutase family protein [Nitrospirae bacterium]|nr:terpene cyclase/mutase family protein [Nitrospirota bacterium]
MIFGWHRNRIILTMLLIGLVFSYSKDSFAQTPSEAINSGTQWFLSARYGMGIWAFKAPPDPLQEEFTADDFTPTYIRDTIEATMSLQYVNVSLTEYESTLDWLEFFALPTTAQLGQKIQILSKAGRNITKTVSEILTAQNIDGGFGGRAGYPSDVLDTAFALHGLVVTNSSDTTAINSAVNYLLSAQNADGGWGFAMGRVSHIYYTALVIRALATLPQNASLATALNKATAYLLTKQNPDGGFGHSASSGQGSSTVYETALVYQILVRTIYDPISWAKAEGYLLTTQSADGSWNQDAYSTALSLRALYDAERLRASQIQSVELYKSVNNQLQLSTTYDAYNRMVIKININDPNVRFDIQVRDSAGNIYNVAIINGEIIFDTGSYPPGTYTIIIRAIDITTGMVVDEESITFTIQPTLAIPTLGISIVPIYTYVTAAQDIKLNAYITNQSNIQADISITHEIKAPSNNIINTGSVNLTLSPNESNKLITLSQFNYQFTEAGEHPVTVNIYRGADLLQTASTKIHVSPLVRIEPKKSLTPSTVAPDGDKRIRIEIELEGKEKP